MVDEHNANMILDTVAIQQLRTSAYKIPTETPEADGTLAWDSTTLVLVEIEAGGHTGIGYTYAHEVTAYFIDDVFKDCVLQQNVFDIAAINQRLMQRVRNNGSCGIAMMAVSAVDNALWDLKAKLCNLPLCKLLGMARYEVPLYGSGGFTSYGIIPLQEQVSAWEESGLNYVKIKVGAEPENDASRVAAARKALTGHTQLFVDANGAYTLKQAVHMANAFEEYGVTWFEEPVSSDNLDGLNFVREHAPASVNFAAGEYGYQLSYFEAMLRAKSVDILQADASRCGGISGFLKAGVLCEAYQMPFSSHAAPALHLHAALAVPSFYISEYYYDHVRIEEMLFDGIPLPENGTLKPDLSRPGFGLEFKHQNAEEFKV